MRNPGSARMLIARVSVTYGRSVRGRIFAHALARVGGGRLPLGKDGHTVTAEPGPQKWYRSLRFKCNGLLHLDRGLPGSIVYDYRASSTYKGS
jgi:hypothetical protein